MTIKIPVEKLGKGIEKCKKQAKTHLDSSEILLKKKKYTSSITLSILGREEITKIRIFRNHMKMNKEIDNKVWKELNNHKIKLALPYLLAYKGLRRKTVPELMEIDQAYRTEGLESKLRIVDLSKPINMKYVQFLESLDILKQDSQFVGWVDNDWFSVLENYSENIQKAFANVMYHEGMDDYYGILLTLNWKKGDKVELPKNITGHKFKKNTQIMQTKKFKQMQQIVYETIKRDYLPRHEEFMKKINKGKKKSK